MWALCRAGLYKISRDGKGRRDLAQRMFVGAAGYVC